MSKGYQPVFQSYWFPSDAKKPWFQYIQIDLYKTLHQKYDTNLIHISQMIQQRAELYEITTNYKGCVRHEHGNKALGIIEYNTYLYRDVICVAFSTYTLTDLRITVNFIFNINITVLFMKTKYVNYTFCEKIILFDTDDILISLCGHIPYVWSLYSKTNVM